MSYYYQVLLSLVLIASYAGCNSLKNYDFEKQDLIPQIEPEYNGITIPPNIAPMNFTIKEPGNYFWITASGTNSSSEIKIKSTDGLIQFPKKLWRNMLQESKGDKIKIDVYVETKNKKKLQYKPFYFHVANESIDPYLVYRQIHPGYYSWSQIKIKQRSLEDFSEESVIENQLIENNCVNCHSFSQNNPEKFLFHMRGSKGGTYFIKGSEASKTELKTEGMPGGATYPSWHPNGRFVAFSSNQVRQNFYSHSDKSIEVYDLISSLILYDIDKNEITHITENDSLIPLETFPSWSPDGKHLYYCKAEINNTVDINSIESIQYNVVRKSFDAVTGRFDTAEIILNASALNKSASFPRISPDGKFLVITLADFGTFPIWHREADLYLLNLINGRIEKMKLNSEMAESYHTWSSNGKWLVFSSKRMDGRSAKAFFSYIDSTGQAMKPFILPLKDPAVYNTMPESYNIPELITGKIKLTPREVASAAQKDPVQASSGNEKEEIPNWNVEDYERKHSETEISAHE